MKPAHIILADGTIFSGTAFGRTGSAGGEVVFNTSMCGYQEILTDPSYEGQIVVMTYPEIGNYGIHKADSESKKIYLSGFVVKEASPIASHFGSHIGLSAWLEKCGIPGVEGVDTRSLVRHIRDRGAMQAIIKIGSIGSASTLVKKAVNLPVMEGRDLAKAVSCKRPYTWSNAALSKVRGGPLNVTAYDFGIKKNILCMLENHGCVVKVVPASFPAEKVLAENPDGVFLSNGPGDPAVCTYAIDNVKKILGKKPVFGICLGHQILGLALGGETFKLKFGHHGGNQPVKDLATGKVEITAQNHGFAINPESLPGNVEVTHVNLNDQTVEGLRHKKLPAFGVQYHPEASPGPHDSHYLFKRFIQMMEQS